jgi:hypothetical protein
MIMEAKSCAAPIQMTTRAKEEALPGGRAVFKKQDRLLIINWY